MSSRYNYPSTRDQYVQDHPHDPLDNDVLVLHFRRTDPHERNIHIASILNYACYGVVLGPDYKMISANYPGYVMERLEQTFGKAGRDTAPYVGLFLQGCAGDIDPWLALTNDYRNVEATGGDVASGSIDAIGQIALSSYTRDTPILFRSSRVKVVGAPLTSSQWRRNKYNETRRQDGAGHVPGGNVCGAWSRSKAKGGRSRFPLHVRVWIYKRCHGLCMYQASLFMERAVTKRILRIRIILC
jgi:hypothetical protein